MKSLLKRLFIEHWPRKIISFAIAMIIWFVVDQSMSTTKTINNVAVRIVNIPEGKTVDGLQTNGLLQKRISLTITGNQQLLDELTPNDFEVVIDANDKENEWIATITKKNLVPLNGDINLNQDISKISHKSFIIKLANLIRDKIPVIITQPIGEAPKGYQFLDIWPYQLNLSVSGPEEVIKKLKNRGLKLTFNLNDISKAQLDDLQSSSPNVHNDVVSFFVPNHWKQLSIPLLSNSPIEIDDPEAKFLRIDFVRYELLPLDNPIPVGLFFPPQFLSLINPQKVSIALNDFIEMKNGLKMITQPLYAKGVSELFIEIVRDMIEIVIIAMPKTEKQMLSWSVQFINPKLLEDRYVSTLMSDASDDEIRELQPKIREEYLRNRFRSYMNRFQLFKPNYTKLELGVELQGAKVIISDRSGSNS